MSESSLVDPDGATVAAVGERGLIARILERLPPTRDTLVGPGDDAAVVRPAKRMAEVLTTDASVEGVHFDRAFCPPDAIGHRALAVNLSDLAAMGAAPRTALLSLILPDHLPLADLDALLQGLVDLARRHDMGIAGGNITRSPGPLIVDVTAVGDVHPRRVLTRSGARPGDEVYVTGELGGASVGLRLLQADAGAAGPAVARYLRPEPRVRAGVLLGRARAASSCIDLSDGLGDGLHQIAAASRVGMRIEADALPVDSALATSADPESALAVVCSAGDDYELLFTARPAHRRRLRGIAGSLGVPITRIGVVTKGRGVVLRTVTGERPMPSGFEHFRHGAGLD